MSKFVYSKHADYKIELVDKSGSCNIYKRRNSKSKYDFWKCAYSVDRAIKRIEKDKAIATDSVKG